MITVSTACVATPGTAKAPSSNFRQKGELLREIGILGPPSTNICFGSPGWTHRVRRRRENDGSSKCGVSAAGPPAQVEALGYLSGAINWHLVDPPPPPAAKLHLAVINQSGGQFTIAAVTWTVWQQTFAGFQLLATANGESVVIQPVVNGQYHIHADVLATRLSIGINELAEFRGAWKGPDAASTLLIGWTGVDLSRTFRLVTEAQTADTGGGYFTIYNPVVEL